MSRTTSAGVPTTLLGAQDLYLLNEGTHRRLATRLGAHVLPGPEPKVAFAVGAPNARAVSVVGDFNGWRADADPLSPVSSSGIWS